eukprot:746690-Hanusia_phi.AAC.1
MSLLFPCHGRHSYPSPAQTHQVVQSAEVVGLNRIHHTAQVACLTVKTTPQNADCRKRTIHTQCLPPSRKVTWQLM